MIDRAWTTTWSGGSVRSSDVRSPRIGADRVSNLRSPTGGPTSCMKPYDTPPEFVDEVVRKAGREMTEKASNERGHG